MNGIIVNIINCMFCWGIVGLAVAGYLLTVKRIRERWMFWIILAISWSLLAVLETMTAIGIDLGRLQITTIWLSSFLLVMASLLLLFLKFIQIKVKSKA
ncbi:MAG: hypothetical protein JW967_05825 [Dehalococcoidales bacterium]|nr:hypothetical protein [Dehalococcoidales bacterium]